MYISEPFKNSIKCSQAHGDSSVNVLGEQWIIGGYTGKLTFSSPVSCQHNTLLQNIILVLLTGTLLDYIRTHH